MNSQNKNNNDTLTGKPELPRFLRIVCILSFVHGGLFIIKHLVSAFEGYNSADISQIVESVSKTSPVSLRYIHEYFENWALGYTVHELSNAVLYGMGLIGVFQMFRLKKRGFFMYGLAHVLLTFYPVVMVVNNPFSQMETIRWGIVTILFIAFYALNMKHMKIA